MLVCITVLDVNNKMTHFFNCSAKKNPHCALFIDLSKIFAVFTHFSVTQPRICLFFFVTHNTNLSFNEWRNFQNFIYFFPNRNFQSTRVNRSIMNEWTLWSALVGERISIMREFGERVKVASTQQWDSHGFSLMRMSNENFVCNVFEECFLLQKSRKMCEFQCWIVNFWLFTIFFCCVFYY